MSSQRLLFSDTVKIILFFSVLVSLSEKINRIRIFLNRCMSERETDQLTQLLFADAGLKAELIPEGTCSLKSAVSREVFKAQESLWLFLHFPVCLYHGWGGPHLHGKFKKSREHRGSLSCHPSIPWIAALHTVLMLTLTPSSDTSLREPFCWTVSHPSSINELVPFGLHFHDQE